jgi:hypothetical protein
MTDPEGTAHLDVIFYYSVTVVQQLRAFVKLFTNRMDAGSAGIRSQGTHSASAISVACVCSFQNRLVGSVNIIHPDLIHKVIQGNGIRILYYTNVPRKGDHLKAT